MKTELQKAIELAEKEIELAVEKALAKGAKIEKSGNGLTIDGVYFVSPTFDKKYACVLHVEPRGLFEIDNNERLIEREQRLKKELEEVQKQIKEGRTEK